MTGKSKILVALTFIFTLIFSVANFSPSVANANSKTVTVKGGRLNGQVIITGKGGWFNKQYSFTITNKGPRQIAVYQVLTPMGVHGNAYLGTISRGQSRTVSFKAKGNIKVGYEFQLSGGSGSNSVVEINTPNGLTVQ